MTGQYILSDYLTRDLAQAEYDKLEDGTFFGRIPACKGVVAFTRRHLARMRRRTALRVGRLGSCRLETRTRIADFEQHKFEREI